jgi:hypothetical protein
MFCDSCGTQLGQSATFCSKCGKSVRGTPLMPQQGRIAGHIRLLGILWLAISALRLIPGLFMMAFASARLFPPDVPDFVRGIIPFLGLMFLLGAGIGIVTGCGLLARQSWARMLAIIFGAFSLVDIPFGTAIGVYTLWVLLPAESEQEYRTMSETAARVA